SFDRTMPEEINRLVTDALADLLFTTTRDAGENLEREGIDPKKVHFVGNVMIDTLLKHREKARSLDTLSKLNVEPGTYALVTLHRLSNVDDPEVFGGIWDALQTVARSVPVIFPVHPRTSKRMAEFGIDRGNVRVTEPFGYLDFLNLMS